jgi:predicted acyltransferase
MNPAILPKSPIRIASIDVLRALTMFGMIFVNDLWTLKDIPHWLEHVSADADGMGFADIVFPGFLFIVGMSIPFAVRNRQAKGDSLQQLSFHIIQRGLALLLMGVFLVNGENIHETAAGLSRGAWNVISWISFMVLWNQYPKHWNKTGVRVAQVLALLVLAALAFIYRGGTTENLSRFATWWWGILGLIGWAYLVAALLFTWVDGKIIPLAVASLVSLLLSAAHHLHWLPEQGLINTLLSPIVHGAMTAFTIGGAWASQVFWKRQQDNQSFSKLSLSFGGAAILLLVLGFLSRPLWGISKIQATPSWVLICIAIFLVLFLLVYWLVDLQQKSSWFSAIRPAGTDTLLCYALPYFAYAMIRPSGLYLPEWALTGLAGLLKSALFSLLIIQVAGWLSKKGLRLKL